MCSKFERGPEFSGTRIVVAFAEDLANDLNELELEQMEV